MKTFLLTILATLLSLAAYACPVCEKQQPNVCRASAAEQARKVTGTTSWPGQRL